MKDKIKRSLIKIAWALDKNSLLKRKGITNNNIQSDEQFLKLFIEIYSKKMAEMSIREMYNIYNLVVSSAKIPGDISEVGVYKGGSARIICEVKGQRGLHLFDTFEGMPEIDPSVDTHKEGDFSDTSLEGVRKYLEGFDNIYFYQGFFPDSTRNLDPSLTFSFVNLDLDIYESTQSALEFFYPRINPGGILLLHDYGSISCPGVKKAVDQFFSGKPEHVIALWDTQCMIVKSSKMRN